MPSTSAAPTSAAAWSRPRQDKAPDLAKARVWKSLLWSHADDEPTREAAVKKLVGMLKQLIKEADEEGLSSALHRRSCPGVIDADGASKRARKIFRQLGKQPIQPAALTGRAIPEIGDNDTTVLMHNDGVAQGLSEVPFMQELKRWGVLTIGTGLGNARFTNRHKSKRRRTKSDKDEKAEKKDKKGREERRQNGKKE